MPVLEGNEQQTSPNVVTVDSRPDPSGGGSSSTVGTPSQKQAPGLPPSNYDVGGDFYYHPSLGVGTMTGVWGDARAGGARRHEGQDIRMPMNTPLVAVTSGTIKHYKNSSAGTVVYLQGDDGNKYSYFHLNSRVAKDGQRVQAGQLIAYSGNTGNSSGPHLHFEVWWNGKKVDPRTFLSHTRSPGSPVDPTQGGDPYFDDPTQTEQPGEGVDLFGERAYEAELASILGGINTNDPNRPYGEWVNDLRRFQGEMAQQGFAPAPRTLKAKEAVHYLLSGMSKMVQGGGYRSKFGDDQPGKVSTAGSNVVTTEELERE